MILKTRSIAMATAALGLLALGLIGWQITSRVPADESGPMVEAPGTTASGVVTRAAVPAPPAPVASAPVPSAPVTPAPDAQAPTVTASLPAPATPTASTEERPAATRPSTSKAAVTAKPPTIKHRVVSRPASQPPILPNEVNRVVGQALGIQALSRYVYMDPLARRFVATVDNLGRQPPATSQWLLKPAPGSLKLAYKQRVAAANSQRYAGFLRWFEATDNARLIALYARMYPLLQQTYVELGHPDGYFNDRVIKVIDQLLATPVQKRALRVKPASPETLAAAALSSTPTQPRYEFADPALEALSTGQKMMLRIGPTQAARLKIKLRALRAGLIRLGR
jgi:Protein of unknown function (DUF3014)